jgi:hypothetical protein
MEYVNSQMSDLLWEEENTRYRCMKMKETDLLIRNKATSEAVTTYKNRLPCHKHKKEFEYVLLIYFQSGSDGYMSTQLPFHRFSQQTQSKSTTSDFIFFTIFVCFVIHFLA